MICLGDIIDGLNRFDFPETREHSKSAMTAVLNEFAKFYRFNAEKEDEDDDAEAAAAATAASSSGSGSGSEATGTWCMHFDVPLYSRVIEHTLVMNETADMLYVYFFYWVRTKMSNQTMI